MFLFGVVFFVSTLKQVVYIKFDGKISIFAFFRGTFSPEGEYFILEGVVYLRYSTAEVGELTLRNFGQRAYFPSLSFDNEFHESVCI